mmetsp:Transcript_27529/g.65396  ORF Transcript_27529/g.65396 Transcript_27529/m.65396 type:complete len:207 (-) Transcript_27529:950-1570(-)
MSLVQHVHAALPRNPSPDHRLGLALLEAQAPKVLRRKPLANGQHGVKVVHGGDVLVRGRVLDVVAVVVKAHLLHRDVRFRAVLLNGRCIVIHAVVNVYDVVDSGLDQLLRSLGEEGAIQRRPRGVHFGRQVTPVRLKVAAHLLPGFLDQEAAVGMLVAVGQLGLQHVHHPHEDRHSIHPAVVLEVGLLRLHLCKQILHGFQLAPAE